ncbi:MAG: hypothetical protein GEU90_09030 [Gemmatimonas sp.]|nr:hypothetical protein [Gemmatimonas sp.]
MITPPWIRSGVALAAVGSIVSCGSGEDPETQTQAAVEGLEIVAVSTRPHLVTGGDVLLRVDADPSVDLSELEVTANGVNVTHGFRRVGEESSMLGLVAGLPLGDSEIGASAPGAQGSALLRITNYPVTGPIISGPHEQPFLCQTDAFEVVSGGTLGVPLDPDCSIDRRADYVYLSSVDAEFKPYSPSDPRPDDLATANTLDGETVPFIVRVETGTVNRAIYEIAMLHDPAEPEPDPWVRSVGWNGKLVYTHGGGCRSGWYQQGDATGGVLRQGLLAMGYAVTSASLNVFGQNCNDLLASETHIMVKERFIESYGEPIYTIATGGSGGSYQSHQTADNYPGVFDGIIVSSSFPDVTSATIFTLADARLLHHYFSEIAPGVFTEEEQRLVSGFGSAGSIPNLSQGAARLDPTYSDAAVEEQQGGEVSLPELEPRRYSEANPSGIRATVYDHTINVYGRDPSTGFAARPLDNYGMQYGLEVLNRAGITKEQFLDLNRRVGGFDRDLNHVPERHRADPVAAERATSTGRILYGGGGLAATPVIDYRTYTDDREGGDIHMIVHQFSTRARLAAANGHADNHVMTIGGRWGFTEGSPDLGQLFRQMDEWLMNLRRNPSAADSTERVAQAKPQDLVDNCWDEDGEERVNIREPLSFDGAGRCSELYPAFPTPRHVAGAPLTNHIVSCTLKPIDPADYNVSFTEGELQQLGEIFPDGVCDWEAGDLHAAEYRGTWLSFGPSPVNLVE